MQSPLRFEVLNNPIENDERKRENYSYLSCI